MNKAQIQYEMCKRIAQDNTTCLSILLELLKEDRADILNQIAELNRIQYNSITPAGIVALYNNSGKDIQKFIKTYDKTMSDAKYIRKNYYDNYQKGMEDFCNG